MLGKNKEVAEKAFLQCASYLRNNLLLEMRSEPVTDIETGHFEFLGIEFWKNGLSISDEKRTNLLKKLDNNIVFFKGRMSNKFYKSLDGIQRYYGRL
ncbi:MAG: hypothetical protein U9Q83_07485, partial [Bacteroidota bacterium]|nr:hypothetical protein [Bacteroidota bacterium]